MKNKDFSLYEWLFEVKKFIRKRLEDDPHIFIFVSGWSASGKTSRVANNIQKFFLDNALMISMDNYYRGKDYVESHSITFDEPEAIDIDLLADHLERLKQWETVFIPKYDFKNSAPILNSIEVKPAQIMIVEWLFTLDHRFDSISDLNIFVETSTSGRLVRRMLRDKERTGQSSEEIIEYFVEVVDKMHKKYIEPQKDNAHMIIYNEFSALLEVRHLNMPDFMKRNNIPHLD